MALLGWVGLVARTAIPQWHVSSQEGDNSITGQARYKGLWMGCVTQGTGVLSCKIGHTGHLVAASRGLGFLATLDTMGTRCASCSGEDQVKRARVALTGGIIFIVKGPAASNRTACSGVATSPVTDFYKPVPPMNVRYKLRPAVFIGWVGSALVILGGALLTCSCSGSDSKDGHRVPRSYPKRNSATQCV
ncbi:claudin-7-like isoform X2 [Panthera leo]|uniref:claudin-7-like isoform X2 n=1 Tax=Panthera leo TaxID=9689 RepID=UPI001C697B3F|nr:claudin-7-like isoform X2 [Panthera leo]